MSYYRPLTYWDKSPDFILQSSDIICKVREDPEKPFISCLRDLRALCIKARKKATLRGAAKHRGLGHIELNEHFEGGEWHHIDKDHVICIPNKLHHSVWHNVYTGRGMEEINTIAFGYITEDMFDNLMMEISLENMKEKQNMDKKTKMEEPKMIKITKKVIGHGNSIGIIIPEPITAAYNISKGDKVIVDILDIIKIDKPAG